MSKPNVMSDEMKRFKLRNSAISCLTKAGRELNSSDYIRTELLLTEALGYLKVLKTIPYPDLKDIPYNGQ